MVPLSLPSGQSTEGLDLPAYLEAVTDTQSTTPRTSSKQYPLDDVFLAPPVTRPRAFLDFYTFEQHVRTCRAKRGLDVVPEWYQVPAYYSSNTSALFGHGMKVPFPPEEDRLDFELEMACIIGTTCRNVAQADADRVIAGYGTAARPVKGRILRALARTRTTEADRLLASALASEETVIPALDALCSANRTVPATALRVRDPVRARQVRAMVRRASQGAVLPHAVGTEIDAGTP